MLISLSKKLVFLAMPKTASTSIEAALFPHCDVAFFNNPKIKHIPYRRYNRFILPYLDQTGFGPLETTCMFREPIDWLISWYKYRSRSAIAGKPQSTAGISFDEFALSYMQQDESSPKIGRPSRFVSDRNGTPSVDHIFRYENLPMYIDFLENRFEQKLEVEFFNVSPLREYTLSKNIRAELESFFTPEFEIYESAR